MAQAETTVVTTNTTTLTLTEDESRALLVLLGAVRTNGNWLGPFYDDTYQAISDAHRAAGLGGYFGVGQAEFRKAFGNDKLNLPNIPVRGGSEPLADWERELLDGQ